MMDAQLTVNNKPRGTQIVAIQRAHRAGVPAAELATWPDQPERPEARPLELAHLERRPQRLEQLSRLSAAELGKPL